MTKKTTNMEPMSCSGKGMMKNPMMSEQQMNAMPMHQAMHNAPKKGKSKKAGM